MSSVSRPNRNPAIRSMTATECSAHFRQLGAAGNRERIVLTRREKETLVEAHSLISSILARHDLLTDGGEEGVDVP